MFLGWQIRDTRALEMNYIWPEWWVDFSTVLYVAPLCYDSSSSFVDYSCFSLTGNWESVMLFPLQALLQMLGRNGGALAFRWHTCLQLYRAAPHFVSAVEQLDCLLGLAKGNSSASHRQEKKSVSSAIAVQLSYISKMLLSGRVIIAISDNLLGSKEARTEWIFGAKRGKRSWFQLLLHLMFDVLSLPTKVETS